MNKNIKWIIIFPIALVIFLTNDFIKSKTEYTTMLSFTISRVRVTPTASLVLYNRNGNEISLWNYTIMSSKGVAVGDSIYKKSCSKLLFVYKKDNNGNYKEYLKIAPSGIIPYSWFCK